MLSLHYSLRTYIAFPVNIKFLTMYILFKKAPFTFFFLAFSTGFSYIPIELRALTLMTLTVVF